MIGKKDWEQTFNAVILHTGSLHIEINSAKHTLTKLIKPLCGQLLADVFGRKSEKSYQYFYSGKNLGGRIFF